MYKRFLCFLFLAVFLFCGCMDESGVSYELSSESGAEGIEEMEEQEATTEDTASGGAEAEPESVFIYVCGAVNSPGIYELPEGSRVYEAVEAAGGMTEDADERSLNQAGLLQDGQQITVYTVEEASGTVPGSGAVPDGLESGRVNLNTAGKELLMTLPGIGEAKAEAILTYRSEHGPFSDIEEIKNIEGIKEKVFEKIEGLIEV